MTDAAKPLVVVLGDAAGAEAPDLLTPYVILAESGAVDVRVIAPTPELIRLVPGMAWIEPQVTFDQLDRTPEVVIVPAMEVDDDPARAAWLRRQLEAGARIMSVCYGAKALASAGLLDGREATTHWYIQRLVRKRWPKVKWRRDRRWVDDGPVTTTAGISASEPATLDLLSDLAGEEVMWATAGRLGLALPDQRHDGRAFRLTLGGMATVTLNRFRRREDVAVPMAQGMDELAFSAVLDGWSRTYRSMAWATGAPGTLSRHGLRFHPGRDLPAHFARTIEPPTADALVRTFEQVRAAYGEPTARFVALQFEHPWGAVGPG